MNQYEKNIKMAEAYNIQEFEPKTISNQPANISITAMTGSGKTFLIIDFLSHVSKDYDHIFIMSRTAKLQEIFDFVPRENIVDGFSEDFIKGVLDYQRESKKKNKKLESFLIIMDDLINDVNYKKSLNIANLYTEGRQYNISTWNLVQKFTGLSPIQRCNVRYAISFDIDTYSERKAFVENYMPCENNQVNHNLFRRITREKKYQCCIIEIYKNGVGVEEKVKKYVASEIKRKPKIKKEDYNKYIIKEVNPYLMGFGMNGYGTSMNIDDLDLTTYEE